MDERTSHKIFLENRNWEGVSQFWRFVLNSKNHSDIFPTNNDEHDNETGYGITQLNDIHKIGRNEYTSSDPRYKKKTFAMRIGYDGAKYQGLFHINVQQSHYLL